MNKPMHKNAAFQALVVVASFVGVVLGVVAGGCTLILPTNELITPCVAQDECEDGFICEDNACLPEDEDDGSGSSG